MSYAPCPPEAGSTESLPAELLELMARIRLLPPDLRAELEPIVAEALEEARFRGRVLSVAREALERLRFDLELTRFDLDATRREREDLRRQLGV
ncbi:MAG: hypothetical protein IRY99_09355 [Isosphaeraceae bacterium]|nr:hypothetical protein [Isosphaeraceae bacterium]